MALILLAITLTSGGYIYVRGEIEKVRFAEREELLWHTFQVELELIQLQQVILEGRLSDAGVDPKHVNSRFDILWSQVGVFEQGTMGARLRSYDEKDGVVAALAEKLKVIEPMVVNLQRDDDAALDAIQAALYPFNRGLRRLSHTVLLGESHAKAERRQALADNTFIMLWLSVVALIASLFLIAFFARDTARYRKDSEQIKKLLDREKDSVRAKSRFLAMVSHDLRTPMNGVLGLLALVKQNGLNASQIALVERAERSGRHLIALLEDVLDFSALQDGTLEFEESPFAPKELAKQVEDQFLPVAKSRNSTFTVRLDQSAPRQVTGDIARIRQAIVHIAFYILDTAGTRDISLTFSFQDETLTAALVFDYAVPGEEWKPDVITGSTSRSEQRIAGQALGPVVSRDLIEKMSGSIKLSGRRDGKIEVLISVPAPVSTVAKLRIRTEFRTQSLEAICRVAMGGKNVEFIGEDSPLAPNVIVLEAGGNNEADKVEALKRAYPKATLVALGQSANASLFDDIIEMPIDIARVRQSDYLALATNYDLAGAGNLG